MRPPSIFLGLLCLTFSTSFAGADEPQLVLQSGHANAVIAALLSDDGKHLVTSSEDGTSIVWDAATGKVLRAFDGRFASLSSDGKLVLTVTKDNAILWELVSGKRLHAFDCGGWTHFWSHSAVLTPDGQQVITGSGNVWNGPDVWDALTGKKIKSFDRGLEFMSTISANENGKIVLGKTRVTAVVWDAASGTILRHFSTRPGSISVGAQNIATAGGQGAWAISGDGSSLIMGDFQDNVFLYKTEDGFRSPRKTFKIQDGSIQQIALSKDGKLAAIGTAVPKVGDKQEPRVTLWDLDNAKVLQTFREGAASLALSADGKQLVIGSGTGAALWDIASGKKVRTFAGRGIAFGKMAPSRDGKRIICDEWGGAPGTVLLWDASGAKKIDLDGLSHGFSISGDAGYVLSGGALWDTAQAKKLKTFEGGLGVYSGDTALSVDGKIVVTKISDGAYVWDTTTGKKIATIKEAAGGKGGGYSTLAAYATPFALSANGRFFVTGSSNGRTAHLWDTATGKELKTFTVHDKEIRGVAVADDGSRVIAFTRIYEDCRIVVWDSATGQRIRTFDLEPGSMGVLLCNGKHILAGEKFGFSLAVWDATLGKKIVTLSGHTNQIVGAGLNADGNLWTASQDGTIRLWHPDGKERLRLYSFDGGKDWLVVAPDGRFDGSPGALRLVAFREPDTLKFLEEDAARKRFHRPGLLAELWKSKKTVAEGAWSAPSEPVNNGRNLLADDGQYGTIRRFFLTADGATLVTDGFDQTIRFWDAKTGKLLGRFDGTDELYGGLLSISPDGKTFLTYPFQKPGPVLDNGLTLWQAATAKKIQHLHLKLGGSPIDGIFSPDGKTLALASNSNANYHFFDVVSGKETRSVRWYDGDSDFSVSPAHYRWSPDGKHFAGLYFKSKPGSLAYFVALWDMTKPGPQVVSEEAKWIRDVAFSADGEYLAWSDDKQAHIWDVRANRKIKTFDVPEYWAHLAFSPDGRYLAAGRTLYPLAADAPTLRLPFAPTYPIFVRDSQTLLAISPEHNVLAFDVGKLEKIKQGGR